MVFAKLVADVVEESRQYGIRKPIVASLVGDVQVEEGRSICLTATFRLTLGLPLYHGASGCRAGGQVSLGEEQGIGFGYRYGIPSSWRQRGSAPRDHIGTDLSNSAP
jgi:hypothetical protein